MGRGATAALSIIGGIILFIGAIVRMTLLKWTLVMDSIWDQYQDAVYFQFGITIFFAFLSIIIGAIAGTTTTNVGIRVCGGLLLILGFIAMLSQYIQYEVISTYGITITVSTTLIYIDPLFVLIAGICGIATNQDQKRWMYMSPPVQHQQQQQQPVIHIYVPQLAITPPAPSPVTPVHRIGILCPRCHAPIQNTNAVFCDQCGQRLVWRNLRVPDEDEDKEQSKDGVLQRVQTKIDELKNGELPPPKRCRNCWKEVTGEGVLFCNYCGNSLED
jgi:hypothetical protein